MGSNAELAILGTGNIGRALAAGLLATGRMKPAEMILTRRDVNRLADLAAEGCQTQSDNVDAVERAATVIVAVEPRQLDDLLEEIRPALDADRHLLISVVSGATIADILRQVQKTVSVVRAMPNTAAALGKSMTCLAAESRDDRDLEKAAAIFTSIGVTLVVDEEQMIPATALCACGIAFFLRAVRAASQAGIEIGFHPEEALMMAAQTALGAAALVADRGDHPERGIDTVTTPRGCTIAGLNELEHRGFSSAMIKGIVTSSEKASSLYETR